MINYKFFALPLVVLILAGCGKNNPSVYRATGCNLESVANATVIDGANFAANKAVGNLAFIGWALDPAASDSPKKFSIVLEDASGNSFIAFCLSSLTQISLKEFSSKFPYDLTPP